MAPSTTLAGEFERAERMMRRALAAEAERDRFLDALERITESYADPKKMVDIAWKALGG